MTLEELKQEKQNHGYSNETIAELSGVPFSTVQKIFSGATASPRQKTLEKLSRVFTPTMQRLPAGTERLSAGTECNRGSSSAYTYSPDYRNSILQDSAPVYGIRKKQQGEYTLEDYLALPDEKRVELIDGVFYDMSSPSMPHQLIGGQIYTRIATFIQQHKGACVPFMAPADVQLDCDDKTIVQPDVMVICDRDKILNARIYGAPDLVIEVLSPSTKRKDITIKTAKYQNAGVREYWMVDPLKEKILVFDFENDDIDASIYTFQDKVPIGIFDGKCVIDFKEIADYISFID